MAKAMTLSYEAGENLYINVTNRCPCACTFCIRNNGDGAYGSDPLWLEHEPDLEEMKADLAKRDLSGYRNIVFCGYGEPLMRLKFVCELAKRNPDINYIAVEVNPNVIYMAAKKVKDEGLRNVYFMQCRAEYLP
ncbi:MAG: radical SAM protein, partial [Oscillospiraceae bacterium]|nr:radical SAM protein [Oscillospiraceae bacterium]